MPENTEPDTEISYVDISSVNLVEGITFVDELTFEKAPSRARRIVKDGDTIISTVRTYLKAIAAINDPPQNMIVSTGFAVIRPKDIVDSRYLSYFLQSQNFVDRVVANSVGVSYPAINASDLVCIPIAYPKKTETQNQIADFLDYKTAQIGRLIEKKKVLIEKLNEKRIALITQAVTKGLNPEVPMKSSGVDWLGEVPAHWEIRRLKECSELISKGTTPSTEGLQILDKGEIRFIKAENISNGTISETPSNYIDQHANLVLKRSILKENDILFVIAGATLGKIAVVKLEHLPANTNQAVAFIRPSCNVNPVYLHYWLQSHFIKEMTWLFAVQSAQPNLAMGVLGNFITLLPDVEEQNQVVDFINSELIKINGLLRINNQTIERLTEYRTALITAAVTGKIDVRNVELGRSG